MKTTNLVLAIGLILIFSYNSNDNGAAACSTKVPDNLPDISLAVFSNSTNITNTFYGTAANKIYIYEARGVGSFR
jgi:hypothetical protein